MVPLSTSILALMYFGDVVFAVSGALTAARYRMDVLGFVLIGTITGIGGGTTRDLLLARKSHTANAQNRLCVRKSFERKVYGNSRRRFCGNTV